MIIRSTKSIRHFELEHIDNEVLLSRLKHDMVREMVHKIIEDKLVQFEFEIGVEELTITSSLYIQKI